jgi:hypothetical protein
MVGLEITREVVQGWLVWFGTVIWLGLDHHRNCSRAVWRAEPCTSSPSAWAQ